jgi:hypothetical protein
VGGVAGQEECFADAIDSEREYDLDLGGVARWWHDWE